MNALKPVTTSIVILAGFVSASGCGARGGDAPARREIKTLTPDTMKEMIERSGARMVSSNPMGYPSDSTDIMVMDLNQGTELSTLVDCGKKQGWWRDSENPKADGPLQKGPNYSKMFDDGAPVIRLERRLGLQAYTHAHYEVHGPITQQNPNEKDEQLPGNPIVSVRSPKFTTQARYFVLARDKAALAACSMTPDERVFDVKLVVRFGKSTESGNWWIAQLDQTDSQPVVPKP